jgi:hypothetical protein
MRESPLIRKQRALYGGDPYGMGQVNALRARGALGAFGTVGPPRVLPGDAPRFVGRHGSSMAALRVMKMGRFGAFGLTPGVSGAASGAATGASIGSAVPVIGTAIGAIAGAIGGAIAGSLNRRDPEQRNFDQAVALWQQSRLSVLNIGNKYLPLAGLFDLNLKGPHIPIYQRYGRMGEEKFVTDLVMQVYNAAQNGTITASDTPQTVMVKVVQPWIDSWGFGPMQDPHADLINLLIMGLIADYVAGLQGQWRATGGDLPRSFASLPPFSLPATGGGSTAAAAAAQSSTTAAVSSSGPIPVSAAQIGQSATPGGTLSFNGSAFTFGTNADGQGNLNVLRNGTDTLTLPSNPVSRGVRLLVGNSGALLLLQAAGDVYGWSGSAWQYLGNQSQSTVTALIPGSATAPTVTSSSTSVPIPAGYTLIGTANGLSAYQGLDQGIYSWNGTSMTPLTGTLTTTAGGSYTVINGQVSSGTSLNTSVPSLTSGAQQLYNTSPVGSGYPSSINVTTAPAPVAPAQPAAMPAISGASVLENPLTVLLAVGALGWLIFGQKKGKAA